MKTYKYLYCLQKNAKIEVLILQLLSYSGYTTNLQCFARLEIGI